jgi:hypothetical protein
MNTDKATISWNPGLKPCPKLIVRPFENTWVGTCWSKQKKIKQTNTTQSGIHLMKNLNQIYNDAVSQYGAGSGEMVTVFSDKGTMHSYIDVYEKYFSVKRSNASLLEIGMMTGGSMYLWQQYFKKYQLTGIDKSPRWNTERPFQTLLQNDPKITLLFGVNSRTSPVPAAVADQKFDPAHAPAVPLNVAPAPNENANLIPMPLSVSHVPLVSPAIVTVFCSNVSADEIVYVNG